MADIPLPRRAYAALQSKLDSRTSVDALSRGMEAGLDDLLQGDAPPAEAAHVDRIVANGARRDRYARSLLAKHFIIRNDIHDGAAQTEARSGLACLQRQMASDKLDLLVELASGTQPAHLAAKRCIALNTLKTRIARGRKVARDIAA